MCTESISESKIAKKDINVYSLKRIIKPYERNFIFPLVGTGRYRLDKIYIAKDEYDYKVKNVEFRKNNCLFDCGCFHTSKNLTVLLKSVIAGEWKNLGKEIAILSASIPEGSIYAKGKNTSCSTILNGKISYISRLLRFNGILYFRDPSIKKGIIKFEEEFC